MIVLAIVQDRVRPYETVYTTAHEVHSTNELNRVNIVYKSYGIVWNCSQVLHPTPGLTLECHTITVRFTRVYTRFYTIAIRPIRFHTIAIRLIRRIIHGQVRPHTVSTSVQSSCMIIQHSNTTENTTTCCHLETTEYLLHNASKEEGPQKNSHRRRFSQREYKKGHQGPPTTSTCWPCRPWWAGGPAGTTWRDTCPCLPSRLPAKIISMSISLIMFSNSLILSSAIF